MAKGWDTYLSLTYLHPEFLKSPDATRFAKISLGVAAGSKLADLLMDVNAICTKFKNEEDFTCEEWLDAWEYLMPLIMKYLSPHAYDTWKKHQLLIYSHCD